jgi:hypothetical protein
MIRAFTCCRLPRFPIALPAVLCATFLLAACGRNQTAPSLEGAENSAATLGSQPAEASLDQQTEQKLDPLTKEDVELYLKVMRAAAERVKTPSASDKAALASAKTILAGSSSGRVPTPEDVKTLERANLVAIFMDQIVADEMKIDGRTYRGIAEAVESVITNPVVAAGSENAANAQPPEHALTPLEKRLADINATNERFLTAYRDEIQKLMSIVRNPANLPK